MKLFKPKPGKSPNSLQTDIYETLEQFEESKKEVISYVIISLISSILLSGFFVQYIIHLFNARKKIVLVKCITYGMFNGWGLILTALFFAVMLVAGFRIFKQFHHNYEIDPDGDFQVSKSGVYGRAHWQTEEERKECFIRDKDPYKIMGDILGQDENGLLYTINGNIKGLNKNMAVFGSSGAGKSAALVKPMIYQNIIRGHSMVITDSKGDLYKDTCEIAIKHGYIMRVLNLKSSEIKNSDGVDFLKILKESEDCDAKAEVLANVIIENTGDGHMDYFAINEMNLTKALLLLVTTNEDYIRAGKDNLAAVYNICTHNNPETLKTMFMMLDEDDPAREAFSIYDQCEPKVKGQILNGMAIRLNKLSNKNLKEVVKNDEIDLLLPMKKRCIYYVVISDMDKAYKFIATLFFSELFIRLCEYADGMTDEERKNRVHVNFILDEYANTGAIPDMDSKVSTIRSRDITTTIILQDIGQLEHMYPDLWETILNNMSIKILLATNDDKTAQWFSNKLGMKTVRVVNKSYEKGAADVIDAPGGFKVSEGQGKRPLMSPDELINELSENDLVIIVSKRFPIKLKKFLDFQHPMDKEKEGKVRIAKKHLPKWRKRILDREREIKQKALEEKLTEERRIAELERKMQEEKERLAREKQQREQEEREIEEALKKREEEQKKKAEELKKNPEKQKPTKDTESEPVKEPDKKQTDAQKQNVSAAAEPAEEEMSIDDISEFEVPEIEIPEMDIPEIEIPEIEIPEITLRNMEEPKITMPEQKQENAVSNSVVTDEKAVKKGWVSKWAMDVDEEEETEEVAENKKEEEVKNQYEVIADTSIHRKNDAKKKREKEAEKKEQEEKRIAGRNNKSDNVVSNLFS